MGRGRWILLESVQYSKMWKDRRYSFFPTTWRYLILLCRISLLGELHAGRSHGSVYRRCGDLPGTHRRFKGFMARYLALLFTFLLLLQILQQQTDVATLRHIACEGRCFVIGCNQYYSKENYTARLQEKLLNDPTCRGTNP